MIENVLPYFRSAMKSLEYKEYTDVFAEDQIPKTIQDKLYHLALGDFSTVKQNQTVIEILCPVTISIYIKGKRETGEGRDKSAKAMSEITRRCLMENRRVEATSFPGIKNVLFDTGGIAPIAEDNDNTFKVTLKFNVFVMMQPS